MPKGLNCGVECGPLLTAEYNFAPVKKTVLFLVVNIYNILLHTNSNKFIPTQRD